MTTLVGSLSECALFPDSPKVSCCLKFVMACETYLHLGRRNVMPITDVNGPSVTYHGSSRQVNSSCCSSALKVASWFLTFGSMPLVAGISVFLGRRHYKVEVDRNLLLRDLARFIQKTDKSWQKYEEVPLRNRQTGDQIINGLHMGDGYEFLDCTGFAVFNRNALGEFTDLRYSGNPKNYEQIVTVCPLEHLGDIYPLLKTENVHEQEPIFETHFIDSNIDWYYLGRSLSDVSSEDTERIARLKWEVLVHDCSVQSELCEFDPVDATPKEFSLNLYAKQIVTRRMEPTSYFQRVFRVFDRAVFEGRKTLVHCAKGVSRSSTLVAAWLIARCGVTAQEAIGFVRSRRSCIKSGFAPQLREYEKQLRQVPIQTTPNTDRKDDGKWLHKRQELEMISPV